MKPRLAAWAAVVLWAALIFVLSGRPRVPGPDIPYADKVLHFCGFAVLGLLLARACERSALPLVAAVALGLLYGASDEVHQMYVPGRSPDVWDWAADAAGVTIAVYTYRNRRARRGDRPRAAPHLRA
ncbi:MAG TPA: VanZ family protein [Longimicrobium sp.]|nr:VanZ family protein [Longimicrobium sp.]